MEALNIEVDFSDVKSRMDVISRLAEAFGFLKQLESEGNTENWNAFSDYFTSLHTESNKVIAEQSKAIHLTIKNFRRYRAGLLNSGYKDDYFQLIDILVMATDKNNRYDKIQFTFNVEN